MTTPNGGCRCRAHSQHRVFRFLFENPGVPLKVAAGELGMTYNAVRLAKSRVTRRHDIARICPTCFEGALDGLVCRNCGAELDSPEVIDAGSFDSQSPVHSIQPLDGLGSATRYTALSLQYGGANLRRLVEKPRDALLERAKSQLWQELKEVMPPDWVVEESTRLLTKEVRGFGMRYPRLLGARNLSSQLVAIVVARLALRYPGLRKRCVTVPAGNKEGRGGGIGA
jgi:hypothetical protein